MKNLPSILVFAMDFKIKERYYNYTYYGYGSEENDIDRMEGARLCAYEEFWIPSDCDRVLKFTIEKT